MRNARRPGRLGGINPKVIAERMGHSSVAFFLDTYGHVLPGMDPDAAEHLADIVLGKEDGAESVGGDRVENEISEAGNRSERGDEGGEAA